ncbi:MAG: hypothetical protein Q9192_004658 [Flavoplaca navasiana]
MPTSLKDLPPELLGDVVSYIEEASTLVRLTLTCKKLHDFIERDGYRVFVHGRFPHHPIPPFWKDAAHALTKLSRAWDRKSLIPRYIEPPQDASRPRPSYPGFRRRGQTMGYQPVIDSYEAWTGSNWTSRRETIAWGAGSDLVLRVKWMGPDIVSKRRRTTPGKGTSVDQHHDSKWWKISEPYLVNGRDDIMTINLLRDEQKPSSDNEFIVVGRASGGLDLVSVHHRGRWSWKRETRFETGRRSVRSASVSKSDPPLLAACLGDQAIAIYHVTIAGQDPMQPLGKILFDELKTPCRLWSTVFLRHDRLAVSLGPHVEPIRVFDIKPNAIPTEDIRRFSFAESHAGGYVQEQPTTAYPLAPLPALSCPCELEGDLFLSGGFDGTIRLHDLRSPAAFIATFNDPINSNTAAIYSLLPLDRGRFLAGSSQFASISLFNMRTVVDQLCLQTHNLESSLAEKSRNQSSISSHHTDLCHSKPSTRHDSRSRDWTCFLADRKNTKHPRNPREWSSPVYSLSSPSLCSPTFFAGIEDHVIQVDVSSTYDRFPDPIYNPEPRIRGISKEDAIQKWDPHRNVMSVNLYEHDSTNIELMHQARIGERQPGDRMPGWDERWYSGKSTPPA